MRRIHLLLASALTMLAACADGGETEVTDGDHCEEAIAKLEQCGLDPSLLKDCSPQTAATILDVDCDALRDDVKVGSGDEHSDGALGWLDRDSVCHFNFECEGQLVCRWDANHYFDSINSSEHLIRFLTLSSGWCLDRAIQGQECDSDGDCAGSGMECYSSSWADLIGTCEPPPPPGGRPEDCEPNTTWCDGNQRMRCGDTTITTINCSLGCAEAFNEDGERMAYCKTGS